MFDCDILVFQMYAPISVEFSSFTGAKEDTNRKKLVNFCIKFKIFLKKRQLFHRLFFNTENKFQCFFHEKALTISSLIMPLQRFHHSYICMLKFHQKGVIRFSKQFYKFFSLIVSVSMKTYRLQTELYTVYSSATQMFMY